jgi:hypothetical protein
MGCSRAFGFQFSLRKRKMVVQTFTRQAEQASNETAISRLARHGGLKEARQKLAQLEAARAEIQAGIDRHKSALNDADGLAQKILNGEPVELQDTFNSEAEASKLAGYAMAIVRQKQAVEHERRSASRDFCDLEAPGHKERSAELADSANRMIQTFDEMERHVVAMRNAGIIVDNRFPLFDGGRLRTIILSLKTIVSQFEKFARE